MNVPEPSAVDRFVLFVNETNDSVKAAHFSVVDYLYAFRGKTRHRITRQTCRRIYFLAAGERLNECGDWVEAAIDEPSLGERYVDALEVTLCGVSSTRGRRFYASCEIAQKPDLHDRFYDAYYMQSRLPVEREAAVTADKLRQLRNAMIAAHPDRGGSNENFIAARARFVAARQRAARAKR